MSLLASQQLINIHPQSAVLSMPTGSGKTWTARQILAYWAESGFNGLYLAPLKALAEEQLAAFQTEFPGLKVSLCTGERVTIDPAHADIIVATTEKFEIFLQRPRLHLPWLAKLQLVVVDELHLLSQPDRGSRLESLIVRVQQINPFVQVVGLSATLSNEEEIAAWLGGIVIRSGKRPVPLKQHFPKHGNDKEKFAILLSILTEGRAIGGQTLIFAASRKRAEKLAAALREAGYKSRHHHAGLMPQERSEAESRFRYGALETLVATSTLEMGINLPARRVVVWDSFQFSNGELEPLSVQSFLQMIGRAGRPGLDDQGDAYLLSPRGISNDRYKRGHPERTVSQLGRPAVLARFILETIDSGLAQSIEEIQFIYSRTLHAHQQGDVDLPGAIAYLLQHGFIGQREESLRVTLLGRISARLGVVPAEVMQLRRFLQAGMETPYDLILAVCCWQSTSPRLWLDQEEIESVESALEFLPALLLDARIDCFPVSRRNLLSAVKMLAIVSLPQSPSVIAETFTVYPVEIIRLRDRVGQALEAVGQLIEPLGFADLRRTCADAITLARTGLPIECLSLTDLKGIGATLALRLWEEGFSPETLAQGTIDQLVGVPGIGRKKAAEIIQSAPSLTPRNYHCPPQAQTQSGQHWNHEIDLYRLRRSLDLKWRSGGRPGLRIVSGGSEDRLVMSQGDRYHCNCPDPSPQCKHILCVQRVDQHPAVLAAIADLPQDCDMSLRSGLARLWQSNSGQR